MQKFKKALIFTGHMIDAPDRPKARFPNRIRVAASKAINSSIIKIKDGCDYAGELIGVSSLAAGGDIMFLEHMIDHQIPYRIVLPHCLDVFIKWSVGEGTTWEGRARSIIDLTPSEHVVVIAGDSTKDQMVDGDYSVCNGVMLSLANKLADDAAMIALWDGEPGFVGGVGSFAQFFRTVFAKGSENFIHIDTNQLMSEL